jgi:hypothetical protein
LRTGSWDAAGRAVEGACLWPRGYAKDIPIKELVP